MDKLTAWIASLHDLTSSLASTVEYRNLRASFASAVGHQIMKAANINQGRENYCIYGIWLDGHDDPIYIGQTMQAERRLWDLAIGESHHLANSFPPEIWQKIVVIRWCDVLNDDILLQDLISSDISREGIGLGLEYFLQCKYKPMVNCNRRKRDGKWYEIDITKSKSRGSMMIPNIATICAKILDIWLELSKTDAGNRVSVSHLFGGVVFPSQMLLKPMDSEAGQF